MVPWPSMTISLREHIATRYALERRVTTGAREIRERAHLSCAEVADRLGVSPATVTRWELGLRTPRGTLLRRYVRLLDEMEAAIKENGHA